MNANSNQKNDSTTAATQKGASTDFSRRSFMQRAALGAIAAGAGLAPSAMPGASSKGGTNNGNNLGNHPNIILLITDQERYPQYWPEGWADKNLPNRKRLANFGLTFTHAFCNTAMCSPSRTTLFTGLYPTQHGVEHTLTTGGCLSPNEPTLQPSMQNIGKLLATAGYNVQYRGKWHMSKDVTALTDASSTDDLIKFGFQGWEPPDAGQDTKPQHFGGGCADYDQRWANQAADFLRSQDAIAGRPFALIVSLINPHDTLAYDKSWNQAVGNSQVGLCYNYLDSAPECFHQGICLPPTVDENLALNFKPQAQVQVLALLAAGLGVLLDDTGPLDALDQKQKYVNFYAFLHKVVDGQIGIVVDALEANQALFNNTIVIRVSDHGEMGLSHGGMRQKTFNAYEETMRVPMVFSNPKLFPKPVQTGAFATLVDLMPTLATLAGVPPNPQLWDFKGHDLTPIIRDAIQNPTNPTATVQDSVLFMFDDDNPGAANPQTIVTQPNHIRAIRDGRYKYTVYFDPCYGQESEFELYDLVNDSEELNNMANKKSPYYNPVLVAEMDAKLRAKMAATGVTFQPNSPYCPPPGATC